MEAERQVVSEREPTDLRIVKRAREIISDEKRWCRRTFAMDANYVPTSSWMPGAQRFCALGALARATLEVAQADGHQFSEATETDQIAACIADRIMGDGVSVDLHGAFKLANINDHHSTNGRLVVIDHFTRYLNEEQGKR